ncbi:HAD-IIIA family hydrolase [Sphaerisporangium album]|uniref:D,D-heptose 1,7-bisphosphate phosphatase n=2 Tax=Sphaerisporangium album TaxID=509200 RepID=A0A367FIP9_9ACTN|nr:HAD-IIIA family hydrolase [Sphaerisporangium album]
MTAAVLFDRDGTLVIDVPYNADPGRVTPMPGVRAALDRLRAASIPIGVVSNQAGVARGLITPAALDAVNARVEELLGPFDIWAVCPHDDEDGCGCRKPAPGLILRAAGVLGVTPRDCVVIGDIGSDMEAARAAGARGILVPTPQTLPAETAAARETAPDLGTAVDMALAGHCVEPPPIRRRFLTPGAHSFRPARDDTPALRVRGPRAAPHEVIPARRRYARRPPASEDRPREAGDPT